MTTEYSEQREREEILKLLEPLFAKAESEGLWFKALYLPSDCPPMLFTPKELRELHAMGKMIWGPGRWVLVPPIQTQEGK